MSPLRGLSGERLDVEPSRRRRIRRVAIKRIDTLSTHLKAAALVAVALLAGLGPRHDATDQQPA
jgi:hypothetical protein